MLKDLEEVNLWRKVDSICKSFDVEKIPNLRKMIAEFYPYLQKTVYKRGQLIFQEGDLTKGCYIIKSGVIELTKWSIIEPPQEFQEENKFRNWQSYCNPQEISLSLIANDQFFGEEDMLRNRKIQITKCQMQVNNFNQSFLQQNLLFKIGVQNIHFLRILYESNRVVEIFEQRAKLKDKWHKDKCDKIKKILNEDYQKKLGRNLLEERKNEILGQKKFEDVENEKKVYKAMTGMFRDTYEKMIWKMSVVDELNLPFMKQNKQLQNEDQESQIKEENLTENQKKSQFKPRSISTDSRFYDLDLNSQKQKVLQYGRLKIQKGSQEMFLQEKKTILVNLQERQMRYLANKKKNSSQKIAEDSLNSINLCKEYLQNQLNGKKNSNLSLNTKYPPQERQNEQEQIQNRKQMYYFNIFSKQYKDWKKKSKSLDRMKSNQQYSITNNNSSYQETENKLQDQFLENSIQYTDLKINAGSNVYLKFPNIKNNIDNLQKQTQKSDNTLINQLSILKQDNTDTVQKKIKDKYQKTKTLENEIQECKNNKNQINHKFDKIQLVNDQQMLQQDENQRQILNKLTCKIIGYQEDLQTKLNKVDKNKQSFLEREGEGILQKRRNDLKMKTSRTSAEVIVSHFMNILNEQEVTTKKKKGKKLKRNKLDIIEQILKGQVWADMQMKRELSKFESKKQFSERKNKSQENSISSLVLQQGQNNKNTETNQLQDCQYHNIFQKIKNQVIEIYKDKRNKNNVHVPAFTVSAYKNNVEMISPNSQLNQSVKLSQNNVIELQQQNDKEQKQKQIKFKEIKRQQQTQIKLNKFPEVKVQNKVDFQDTGNKIDEVNLNSYTQTEDLYLQEQYDQKQQLLNSIPKPWVIEKVNRSNSTLLLEAYVQRQKLINPITSLKNEEDNLKTIELQQNFTNLSINKKISEYSLSSSGLEKIVNIECSQIQKESMQTETKQNEIQSSNQTMDSNNPTNNYIVNYYTPLKTNNNRTFSQHSAQPKSNQFIDKINQRKRILSSQITSTNQNQSQIIQNNISNEDSKQYKVIVSKSQNIIKSSERERSQTQDQINQNRYSQIQKHSITNNINKSNEGSQSQSKSIQNLSSEKMKANNQSFKQNRNNEKLINSIDLKVKEILQDEYDKTALNNQQRNSSQIIKTQIHQPSILLREKNSRQCTQRINECDKSDSSILKVLNSSQLNYLKTLNIQNKPNSLIVINHQGKPISYQFK